MPEPKVIPLADWKALERAGDAPRDVGVRKAWSCDEVLTKAEQPSLGEREVAIIISTAKPDRDNDVINADGWKLTNYKKNPVVLWAHDYRSLPIARARKVVAGDGVLRAIDHFVEQEVYPLAEIVLQMLKRGYLNAASVGFAPLKWLRNEERGGYDFEEQELLEHSIVPVPANAGALVEMRGIKGLDLKPLVEWCEKVLDEHGTPPGPVDPRRIAEAMKEATGRLLVGWSPTNAPVPELAGFELREVSPAGTPPAPDTPPAPTPKTAPAPPPAPPAPEHAEAWHDEKGSRVFFKQGFVVQSLIFPKKHWDSLAAVKKWASDHDFRTDKVDETENSWRLRQRDPGDFKRLRTICIMPNDAGPGEDRCRVKAVGGPVKASDEARSVAPRIDGGDVDAGLVLAAWFETVERGVIPYRRTPIAAEGEAWDAVTELGKADVDDLKLMACHYAADGLKAEDYRLIHHRAEGDHACVWRGVANAAARLPVSGLGPAEQAACRRHLGRHYDEFGKQAPWTADPGSWERFEVTSAAWAETAKRELAAEELAGLLRKFGFEAEARAVDESGESEAATALLAQLGISALEEPKGDVVTDDDIKQMHRELIGPAVDELIRKRMGRLD